MKSSSLRWVIGGAVVAVTIGVVAEVIRRARSCSELATAPSLGDRTADTREPVLR